MVIASIDMKNGHVVQLKNGKDPVLERDDPFLLMQSFNVFGEVAIIDLDAALENNTNFSTGETPNTKILQSLLRKGNVRVGGGIRTVKRAKELISLGAEKIIIGSNAFKLNTTTGEYTLNTDFLEKLVGAIGKQRIIIAVDSRNGFITLKGWTEQSTLPLIQTAKQVEKYASELLFTCVEREGCMCGADFEQIHMLRNAVQCRLVVAGGINSLTEIVQLEKINVDVQLGMALYTEKVKLQDTFIECLNWEKAQTQTNGLIPVIAQSVNGEVLMTGFSNKEAFYKTFSTKHLTFWSRTRNKLWTKGETSGNVLKVKKLRADCDRDTVLATVIPAGGVCHTGSNSCFSAEVAPPYSLSLLVKILKTRLENPTAGSYTASLTHERVLEKIAEESTELIEAAQEKDIHEIIHESADVVYFMSVLLAQNNLDWQDVINELDRRHKK